MTIFLLLFDCYGLAFVWHPLWREDGSVFGSESLGTHDCILLFQSLDFSFRRLLRLAGLRWRYSIPPQHGLPRTVSQNHIAAHSLLKIVIFLTVVLQPPRRPSTENIVLLLHKEDHRENESRDSYLASPLARRLLPSNEL
jgi:hypothetical protein